MKFTRFMIVLLLLSPVKNISAQGKIQPYGYIDHGNTIEFVFGDQQQLVIGGLLINMDQRRKEIKTVTLAADFNGWKPSDTNYLLQPGGLLYKIIIPKNSIGKAGEIHQFKFVLNGKYWVEPPATAPNKFKGTDGNVNLTVTL